MGFWDRFRSKKTAEADWTWPEPPRAQNNNDEYISPPEWGRFGGSKYPGGVQGLVDEITSLDYWTLRSRSSALFNTNTYAKGIIRRLVTNVITTGLTPECVPEEAILGFEEDYLMENWCEDVENRFTLWADDEEVCDNKGSRDFGALQRSIYREALIDGDCVVVMRQDPQTSLPQLQIINGSRIRTPDTMPVTPRIVDGVELDENGRHVAYWVYQGTSEIYDHTWERIPVYGELTGRRNAWMVYGYDKREDAIRGEPLLAIAIQPLVEIDKYRDSAQRKALINSMIVGFIERSDKTAPASLPVQGGAVRKRLLQGDPDGTTNPVTVSEIMPGVYMERLQPGEKPSPYSVNGTDVNFKPFESAILVGLAWALEIPPEILLLSFDKNYSASQAAINEFKILLNRERPRFGAENNDHVFKDWMISEVLLGRIEARGFLEALNDPMQRETVQAWLKVDWNGAVKPSTDVVKQTTGYTVMTKEGWITNDRAARELTGTKYSKNTRRLRKENEMKMDAIRPILEMKKKYGEAEVESALKESAQNVISIEGKAR